MAWAGASSSENEEEQTVARDILEAEWTGISGGWKRGKRQVLRLTIWLQNLRQAFYTGCLGWGLF